MRKLSLGTSVALLSLTLACGSAAANGGQPDPGFGAGGRVAPEVAVVALSRAADGTLLLTGSAAVNGTDPNNELPYSWQTFGLQWLGDDGSGRRTVVSRDGLRFGEAIAATATATDSAGRVWIAGGDRGDGYSAGQDVVVQRRLADGALDSTFGDGGVVHVSAGLPNVMNEVVALLVQPDGRAVVATKTGRLFRLNPDGALDSAFGIADPGALALTDGFLDSRGRIVVAGQFDDPSGSESSPAGLAILDADGHLGPRFTLPGNLGVMAAALAPGDQAILAGDSVVQTSDPRTDVVNWAARVSLTTGAPDPSFGDHGSFTRAFGTRLQTEGYYEFVHDLAVGRDGAAILGGQYRAVADSNGNAKGHGFLIRLTPGGRLDTSFGNGGLAPSADEGAPVTAVALDATGRALAAAAGNGLHRVTAATAEDTAWPDPVVALASPNGGGAPAALSSAQATTTTTTAGSGAGAIGGASAAGAGKRAAPLARMRIHNGRLAVSLTCPRAHHGVCRGRVRLALGRTTLASRTLRVAHGTTIRASLTLSKAARHRVAGGWHTVTLTIPWLSSPRRLSVR
jgi:uncharacterized delta-60 repeat protein